MADGAVFVAQPDRLTLYCLLTLPACQLDGNSKPAAGTSDGFSAPGWEVLFPHVHVACTCSVHAQQPAHVVPKLAHAVVCALLMPVMCVQV